MGGGDEGRPSEQVDVGRADEARSPTPTGSDEPVNRIACEIVELLSLGETSLCTLVPHALPAERLTLNLSSAMLRQLALSPGKPLRLHIPTEAVHIMLTVHKTGAAVAGVYTRDVAETKAQEVMTYAREQQMPLLITTEPE